ncbi:MAG: electron transfer flavoprotein subunit alpha/FixB family protein [Actinobacteria bacterium]|nr:electron transfer flavoprotein subunit alpha/FixB family protein [Actinomycetota bacterium]
MAINSVWVFAQVTNGAATTGTLELLTKARSLSSNVTAVLGGDASGVAAQLGEFGATKVYATGDLAGKLPGVAVNYEGRDVLARLSVKLNKSVLTNSIDVAVDGDAVNATTPIFGGNTLVTTTFTGEGPYLVAFRPKSFAAEASGGAPAAITAAAVPDLGATGGAKVTAVHVEESTGPKLDEANIVVSGGRGLGEADKYAMVEELAKLLKGAPGASRAIVDAGWVPYSYQVGQTGKVVKPSVYIAAGISGATQHMVGMKVIEALKGR